MLKSVMWITTAGGRRAVGDLEQHVGVARLIERAPAYEIPAGERGSYLGERRRRRGGDDGRENDSHRAARPLGPKPAGRHAGTAADQPGAIDRDRGGEAPGAVGAKPMGERGPAIYLAAEIERISPHGRPADIDRALGHPPALGALALEAAGAAGHHASPTSIAFDVRDGISSYRGSNFVSSETAAVVIIVGAAFGLERIV